jgi:hypothetical protein
MEDCDMGRGVILMWVIKRNTGPHQLCNDCALEGLMQVRIEYIYGQCMCTYSGVQFKSKLLDSGA